jgi:hypothetical protein
MRFSASLRIPLAVVTNVLGQPRRAFPGARVAKLPPRLRVHRRLAREFRRDFDKRFGDEHRVRLQSEPLRLQRNRTSAAKRVIHRRRFPIARTQDFISRCLKHPLVVRVLPLHQFLDDAKEPLPLRLPRLLGRELLRVRRRIIPSRERKAAFTTWPLCEATPWKSP